MPVEVPRYVCGAVHAERLHEPQVWRAVQRLLTDAKRRRLKLTFFVHPYWAIQSGRDLVAPLEEILNAGHEIAQHTHFYFEGKQTVLSDENVTRRLDEDLSVLRGC